MADRTPRTRETRDEELRSTPWVPQGTLPVPEPRDGIHFRWVRTAALGSADLGNVSRRFREGYVPVPAVEFPELKILSDLDSRFPDNIEVGGLLLCALPTKRAEARTAVDTRRAQAQIASVDQGYLRQSDPRMPVLTPERSSRTSFGNG